MWRYDQSKQDLVVPIADETITTQFLNRSDLSFRIDDRNFESIQLE